MTHLAHVTDDAFTERQLDQFEHVSEIVQQRLGNVPVWHLSNSGGVLGGDPLRAVSASQRWVRPGLALYGTAWDLKVPPHIELEPVMSVTSRLALIKWIPERTPVSYSRTFVTKRRTRLAVVPIGYADGYPWSLSNKAFVLVHGERVPVLGRVTMDMIMIDVTDVSDPKVGDEVVLIGGRGKETIAVDEIAHWAGTIPYEILCGMSKRLPRVYE